MERTYRRLADRVAVGALAALLVSLSLPSSSPAAGVPAQRLDALADGAPLARDAGYADTGEADRVRAVQQTLRRLGWRPGQVDGLYGPRTEAAVVRFQSAAGLAADGVVGPATAKALAQAGSGSLRRGAGYQKQTGSQRVRALQRRLRQAGIDPGRLDGRYGPKTEAAVASLQRRAGLEASGAVDARTQRAVARAARGSNLDQRTVAKRNEKGLDAARLSQAVGGLAVSPLAGPTANAGTDVALWLAIAIAALALIIGALTGVVLATRRIRRKAAALTAASDDTEDRPRPGRLETAAPGNLAAVPEPAAVARGNGGETAPHGSETVRAVGYVSVPKANGEDMAGMEAQADAIARLCERRGWELLHVVRDVENGHAKGMERPGLLYALERIAEGQASCLVVSELERLSRSAADLGRIVEWIDERDARLVAIDLRLDTGSAQGRLTARTLVAVGEWEGRRIGEQTKKGLAAARARRTTGGRPAVEDVPALKNRIVQMRADGMTLQAIADQLNAEGTPTLRGGAEWRPSSVQAAAGYRRPKSKRSGVSDAPKEGGG